MKHLITILLLLLTRSVWSADDSVFGTHCLKCEPFQVAGQLKGCSLVYLAVVADRMYTLSCIVESGKAAGLEFQYQINETAKTIWASRQDTPTQINIGPTDIRFKQGQADISISRNTGRYSNSILPSYLATGICQIITQRKF